MENYVLENFTVLQTGTTGTAMSLGSSNPLASLTVKDLTIGNANIGLRIYQSFAEITLQAVNISTNQYCLWMENTVKSDITIENCTFENCAKQSQISSNARNVTLFQNKFIRSDWIEIYPTLQILRFNVTSNSFVDCFRLIHYTLLQPNNFYFPTIILLGQIVRTIFEQISTLMLQVK